MKSLFVIVNILFLFTSINNASTTLTACANTVAIAAPAASILRPATSKRSPTIFITQAAATNISGDLLSPSPLKIADKRLYATIKNIPPPQIFTYTDVSPTASEGACMTMAMRREKHIITKNNTAEIIANIIIEPPITCPISSCFFSPIYLAISTVMPIANCVITNVTRLSTWLPVETADNPEVVPNRPTTSRSTAPYAACSISAPSIGIINGINLPSMLPCVKSDFELFNVNSPFTHYFIKLFYCINHTISLFL